MYSSAALRVSSPSRLNQYHQSSHLLLSTPRPVRKLFLDNDSSLSCKHPPIFTSQDSGERRLQKRLRKQDANHPTKRRVSTIAGEPQRRSSLQSGNRAIPPPSLSGPGLSDLLATPNVRKQGMLITIPGTRSRRPPN
jgi:hypothetical protein